MNVSRMEQRVLHVLAQGGHIRHHRDDSGAVAAIDCFNRDGHRLADCTLDIFHKLRRRRLIESRGGGPYRISRSGRRAVRSQPDNR